MTTKMIEADQLQATSRDLIIVKATYTVKKEFVPENQDNIKHFMEDLRHHQGIRYLAFLGDDGQTFTHLAVSESIEAQKEFLALESFLNFQKQRDENLVGSPKLESFTLVASSFDLFNQ
jgi:hypothetical protein